MPVIALTQLSTLELGQENPGELDLESGEGQAIEVPIACDEDLGVVLQRQRDQVVVAGIVRDTPWRIARIRSPDRFLLDPATELGDLLGGDAVTASDSRVYKCPANFLDETGACDQLEGSVAPKVEKTRGRP